MSLLLGVLLTLILVMLTLAVLMLGALYSKLKDLLELLECATEPDVEQVFINSGYEDVIN